MRIATASLILAIGCQASPGKSFTSERSTETTTSAASNLGFAYQATSAPMSGLTATNVADGINQSAAVGYFAVSHADQAGAQALAGAEHYTDSAVGAEALLRQQGDSSAISTADGYTDSAVAAEALLRQQGVSTAISTAEGYTDSKVGAETLLRQQGVSTAISTAEAYADAKIGVEAGARAQGDSSTLSAAKAYTDAAIGAGGPQPVNLAPFGTAFESPTSCSSNNGVLSGFCDTSLEPVRHAGQLVDVTAVSISGNDGLLEVDFCNSQTGACFSVELPQPNGSFDQEFNPPLRVDTMSVISNGNHFSYSVMAAPAGSGKAAEQAPFGSGATIISCDTNNGVQTGFCGKNGDGVMTAPQMLNLTALSFSDPDGVIVNLCNSQTNACFAVPVPAGRPVFRQFQHPLQVDQMEILCAGGSCNGELTYGVAGYY
jgi:hypothetical protein